MRQNLNIDRRAMLTGFAAASVAVPVLCVPTATPAPLTKAHVLQRLDANFWETVGRINGDTWRAMSADERRSAMASFNSLMRSIDGAAEVVWSEPVHSADDIAARALLAKHYSQPIGSSSTRLSSQDRPHHERAIRELLATIPVLLDVLSA